MHADQRRLLKILHHTVVGFRFRANEIQLDFLRCHQKIICQINNFIFSSAYLFHYLAFSLKLFVKLTTCPDGILAAQKRKLKTGQGEEKIDRSDASVRAMQTRSLRQTQATTPTTTSASIPTEQRVGGPGLEESSMSGLG